MVGAATVAATMAAATEVLAMEEAGKVAAATGVEAMAAD